MKNIYTATRDIESDSSMRDAKTRVNRPRAAMVKEIEDKKSVEEVVRRLLKNILQQNASTIVFHPEWYRKL